MGWSKKWKKFKEAATDMINQAGKEIDKRFLADKEDRAESCLDYLRNEKNIKICNLETGKGALTASDLNGIGVDRILDEHYGEACLEEFKKKGFVRCDELDSLRVAPKVNPLLTTNIETAFSQASSNADIIKINYEENAIVKIPNTTGADTISIGKAMKISGREISGCKYVVQNFKPELGGKLDFSAFPNVDFDDLAISTIKMNELPTTAIHMSGVLPEYLVCLYDYDKGFNSEDAIFSNPEYFHTEL